MELSITLFFIAVLIFSIIIHEVSHGYAAEMLGDPTARLSGRLTLNPIPHIDLFGSVLIPAFLVLSGAGFLFGYAKPVPYNPYNLKRGGKWAEAIVAGAGPAVNILLAVMFALLIRFGAPLLPAVSIQLIALVVYVNILLALFNLVPIPPLDGSKVLKAVLPLRLALAYGKFEALTVQYGLLMVILFLYLFITLIGPVFFAFISLVFGLLTGLPLGSLL